MFRKAWVDMISSTMTLMKALYLTATPLSIKIVMANLRLLGVWVWIIISLGCDHSASGQTNSNEEVETSDSPTGASESAGNCPSKPQFLDDVNSNKQIQDCTIQASWLSEALESPSTEVWGISLQNVTILGDFKLGSSKESQRDISPQLFCRECNFKGRVVFDHRSFKKDVLFEDECHFEQSVTFRHASFSVLAMHGSCSRLKVDHCMISKGFFRLSPVETLICFSTKFLNSSSFDSSQFAKDGRCTFHDVDFNSQATFRSVNFPGNSGFNRIVFSSEADFTGAWIGSLQFINSTFNGDSFFDQLNVPRSVETEEPLAEDSSSKNADEESEIDYPNTSGKLEFNGVRFRGRASFSRSVLDRLQFGPQHGNVGYVPFEKSAHFEGITCRTLSMVGTEFADNVSFAGSKLTNSVLLERVAFQKDLNVENVRFPHAQSQLKLQYPHEGSKSDEQRIEPGIALREVRFDNAVEGRWSAFVQRRRLLFDDKLRITFCPSETWFSMSDGFKRAGNLIGENEATFQGRIAAGSDDSSENKWLNWFSWAFWGYGYRPSRVLLWLIATAVLFAGFYWQETADLAVPQSGLIRVSSRWRFSLIFSLRTAWSFAYGYKNSRTPFFKLLTSIQSIISKVMLICLLQAIANTSPLLDSIFGKIIKI